MMNRALIITAVPITTASGAPLPSRSKAAIWETMAKARKENATTSAIVAPFSTPVTPVTRPKGTAPTSSGLTATAPWSQASSGLGRRLAREVQVDRITPPVRARAR